MARQPPYTGSRPLDVSDVPYGLVDLPCNLFQAPLETTETEFSHCLLLSYPISCHPSLDLEVGHPCLSKGRDPFQLPGTQSLSHLHQWVLGPSQKEPPERQAQNILPMGCPSLLFSGATATGRPACTGSRTAISDPD